MDDLYVRDRLPHGADAPAAAREVVDAVAADRLPTSALSELRLVVSELVTNAVRHGLARGGGIDLAIALEDGRARVEVTDGGDGFDAPRTRPRPEELGGWGLVVVDRLASAWGTEGGRATRVWAELAVEADGAAPTAAKQPVGARNV